MPIETDNIVTISFQNSSGKDPPKNVKNSAEPPQKNKRFPIEAFAWSG